MQMMRRVHASLFGLSLVGCMPRLTASPAPVPTPPSAGESGETSGCEESARLTAQIARLRAEGKLNRTVRVLNRARSLCPAGAKDTTSVLLDSLLELGRFDEVKALAQAVLSDSSMGEEERGRAIDALEKVRASRRKGRKVSAVALLNEAAGHAPGSRERQLGFDRAIVALEREHQSLLRLDFESADRLARAPTPAWTNDERLLMPMGDHVVSIDPKTGARRALEFEAWTVLTHERSKHIVLAADESVRILDGQLKSLAQFRTFSLFDAAGMFSPDGSRFVFKGRAHRDSTGKHPAGFHVFNFSSGTIERTLQATPIERRSSPIFADIRADVPSGQLELRHVGNLGVIANKAQGYVMWSFRDGSPLAAFRARQLPYHTSPLVDLGRGQWLVPHPARASEPHSWGFSIVDQLTGRERARGSVPDCLLFFPTFPDQRADEVMGVVCASASAAGSMRLVEIDRRTGHWKEVRALSRDESSRFLLGRRPRMVPRRPVEYGFRTKKFLFDAVPAPLALVAGEDTVENITKGVTLDGVNARTNLLISPRGNYATKRRGPWAPVWDVATGRVVHRFFHYEDARSLSWSEGTFEVVGEHGTVTEWVAGSPCKMRVRPRSQAFASEKPASTLSSSLSGAAADVRAELQGNVLSTHRRHPTSKNWVSEKSLQLDPSPLAIEPALSPNGAFVAVAFGTSGDIRFYRTADLHHVATLRPVANGEAALLIDEETRAVELVGAQEKAFPFLRCRVSDVQLPLEICSESLYVTGRLSKLLHGVEPLKELGGKREH